MTLQFIYQYFVKDYYLMLFHVELGLEKLHRKRRHDSGANDLERPLQACVIGLLLQI